jgi:hypothetical protein
MATSGPTNVPQYLATDADFRTFVQATAAKLTACGLVQTADTGQIDPTAVLKPTAVNTAAGYQIWRFDDALQATRPIFVKLEYGVGAAVDRPSLWLTVGSGSNGSGTLTGVTSARTQLAWANSAASGALAPAYASGAAGAGGNGRAWFTLAGLEEAGSRNAWALIARTLDAGGTPTGDGVVVVLANASTATQAVLIPGDGSAVRSLLLTGAFGFARQPDSMGKAVVGTDVGVDPFVFFYGKPLYGLGVALLGGSVGSLGIFTATVLGAQHTFIVMSAASAPFVGGGCAALPWE